MLTCLPFPLPCLSVYSHRAKVKVTSLGWTTLICTGVHTPSESEREVTFLIACGPIGAKAKAIFLSFFFVVGNEQRLFYLQVFCGVELSSRGSGT